MSEVGTYSRIFKVIASIILFITRFQYSIMCVICSGYKNKISLLFIDYLIKFQEILYNQSRFEIGLFK